MIKNRKRNLTMLAVMMFVCAAVALNYSYNSRWGKPDAEMVYAEDEAMLAAQTAFEKTLMTSGTEYFAEARLTRQVSRDEALELLQTAAASESASQETIDSAMSAITSMAACSNFADCVVYIGTDKVTVAVPAPMEGLSEEAVARITDVICTETDYRPAQLSIIEVKA